MKKIAPSSLFLYLNEDSDWDLRSFRSKMDCLILEDGTDRLSQNVGTSALRKFRKRTQISLTPRRKPEKTQDSGYENNATVTIQPTQLRTAVWSIDMKIVNIVRVHNCRIVGCTHGHNCDMRLSLWSLMPSIFNISVPTSQRKRLQFIRRSIGVGTQPEPFRRTFD